MRKDVLIVGGGVLGVTLSYHLACRGISSAVLEKEQSLGTHASGKNAGMIQQLSNHPALRDWAYRSIRSWPAELRESSFRMTGSVVAGKEAPTEPREVFRQIAVTISGRDGKRSIPAVYTETDGLLDPHNYLYTLQSLADKNFAGFKTNQRAVEISHSASANEWQIRTAADELFQGRWLVNAAGAWVNDIIDCCSGRGSMPSGRLQPFARHLFVVKGWPTDFMPAPGCGFYWDEIGHWYMRLWSADERLVSICDKDQADPDRYSPPGNINERLAEKLLSALPEVASGLQVAASWHCFRTYAEDSLPVFGPDPVRPNYFWLAAFGGFGMSTSYAATADAARFISGDEVAIAADFSPARLLSGCP